MSKPKPPSPRSVSATLRTAGFKAIGDGDEGYICAWFRDIPGSAVHVSFHAYCGDGSAAAGDEARELENKALASMGDALRRKGWAAEEWETFGCLIVTATGLSAPRERESSD